MGRYANSYRNGALGYSQSSRNYSSTPWRPGTGLSTGGAPDRSVPWWNQPVPGYEPPPWVWTPRKGATSVPQVAAKWLPRLKPDNIGLVYRLGRYWFYPHGAPLRSPGGEWELVCSTGTGSRMNGQGFSDPTPHCGRQQSNDDRFYYNQWVNNWRAAFYYQDNQDAIGICTMTQQWNLPAGVPIPETVPQVKPVLQGPQYWLPPAPRFFPNVKVNTGIERWQRDPELGIGNEVDLADAVSNVSWYSPSTAGGVSPDVNPALPVYTPGYNPAVPAIPIHIPGFLPSFPGSVGSPVPPSYPTPPEPSPPRTDPSSPLAEAGRGETIQMYPTRSEPRPPDAYENSWRPGKDRKQRTPQGKAGKVSRGSMGVATEMVDLLRCFHNAMPKEHRFKMKPIRYKDASGKWQTRVKTNDRGQPLGPTPLQMAGKVLENWTKGTDSQRQGKVSRALACAGAEAAQDWILGKTSQKAADAFNKAQGNRPHGLETGPAL